jgi:hypothetical protein
LPAKAEKEVVTEGGRLGSLHYLAKRRDIEQNCPVPCLGKSADAAMRPDDQFVT